MLVTPYLQSQKRKGMALDLGKNGVSSLISVKGFG